MNQNERIAKTTDYIKDVFSKDATGHDWWHILRVRDMALKLSDIEKADPYLVEMAALLHDLDDWKLSEGEGLSKASKWLDEIDEPSNSKAQILDIIETVSFKGAGVDTIPASIEGKVVQDADRLDALGAIGIARAFSYGGNKNRSMYEPGEPPNTHTSFDDYKKSKGHTVNHFYEKLLLLKDRMHTASGKRVAISRHAFMQVYLDQFFMEWKGIA